MKTSVKRDPLNSLLFYRAAPLGRPAAHLDSLPGETWFLAISFFYAVSAAVGLRLFSEFPTFAYFAVFTDYMRLFATGGLLIVLPLHFGYVVLTQRPQRVGPHVLNHLRGLASMRRFALALPAFFAYPAFLAAYTVWKNLIPAINPFTWDADLAELGRRLHGGYDLWQWLQPVFGHPLLTHLLDVLYPFWFVVVFSVILWQIFDRRDPSLRLQFMMTFLLVTIFLGTVAATIFSSAGPCYYGKVSASPDVFVPLMQYLHSVSQGVPLFALPIQKSLWLEYQNREFVLSYGISAMPSMHMAMATLLALLGSRISRVLGIVFSIFAALIFVGSIELGWHYSLDDYTAVAGTIGIWFAVGLLVAPALRVPPGQQP